MDFSKVRETAGLAVLAGMAIGLGGYVYLKVGGVVGACMFSFGLLTVTHYGLALYTGKSGFVNFTKEGLFYLFAVVLVGNIIGTGITSLFVFDDSIVEAAKGIVNKRVTAGPWQNFLLGIPCGIIMTVAVRFAREQKFLPLLFGVPLFILCGFCHSIADAFYYWVAGIFNAEVLLNWAVVVVGNFIGCNFIRGSFNLSGHVD